MSSIAKQQQFVSAVDLDEFKATVNKMLDTGWLAYPTTLKSDERGYWVLLYVPKAIGEERAATERKRPFHRSAGLPDE